MLLYCQRRRSSRGVDIQTPQTAVLKHPIFNGVVVISYLYQLDDDDNNIYYNYKVFYVVLVFCVSSSNSAGRKQGGLEE